MRAKCNRQFERLLSQSPFACQAMMMAQRCDHVSELIVALTWQWNMITDPKHEPGTNVRLVGSEACADDIAWLVDTAPFPQFAEKRCVMITQPMAFHEGDFIRPGLWLDLHNFANAQGSGVDVPTLNTPILAPFQLPATPPQQGLDISVKFDDSQCVVTQTSKSTTSLPPSDHFHVCTNWERPGASPGTEPSTNTGDRPAAT